MLTEKEIMSLDDFVDYVIHLSGSKKDWITSDFMKIVQNKILSTIRSNEKIISADIAIAFFHMYALLPKKSSQDRIRATVLSIQDWVKKSR